METSARDFSAIKHMYGYCLEIERTLSEINFDRTKYDNSSTHRNALALCILQIGELVGVLSDEFKMDNKSIPWRDIKQMRNIVAHKYGSFDFDLLWEVVTEDIIELRHFCENYIKN